MPMASGIGIAACRHRPYLKHVRSGQRGFRTRAIPLREHPMSQLPSPSLVAARPLVALVAVAAALIAVGAAFWVHYGTAVFYEMIAAGVAWCL
jgi:hypothetical protein